MPNSERVANAKLGETLAIAALLVNRSKTDAQNRLKRTTSRATTYLTNKSQKSFCA